MLRVEPVSVPDDHHGEGPTWVDREQALYWVDAFEEPSIQRFEPATGRFASWAVHKPVCCLAPCKEGGLVAGMDGGFHLVDPSGVAELAAAPAGLVDGEILCDGKCDSAGRFWCASLDLGLASPIGNLYRLDPDLTVTVMDRGFVTGNGVAFSPDGSVLYVADSRRETVWAYDFDVERGSIANKRVFFSTLELVGRPDGATVDSEGNYWFALVQGSAVVAISPKGKLIERIDLPVEFPTMCTFGGRERDTLYVTTSRQRLNAEQRQRQPLAGSLFAVAGTGARGVPTACFGR